MTIITAIMAFFQAIPALTQGFTAFTQAHYDAKVRITQARVGGDVDVAKQLVTGVVAEGQTRVAFLHEVAQSKFLQFMVGGWSLPWMFYQAKVVAYDNIISYWFFGVAGSTPEIKGTVGTWAAIILGGIFGVGGTMAIGQMFYSRKDK